MLSRSPRPSLLAALAAACFGLAVGTTPASGATVFRGAGDTVTTYSDRGEYAMSGNDFIGQGEPYLWRGTDSTVEVEGYPEELTVRALGPTGKRLRATFAAPTGRPLERGKYLDARYQHDRTSEQPAIDISKDGNGCQPTGRFEVRDIARDARGEITRLWMLFEQSCNVDVPAFWGEIRLGETDAPDGPRLSPTVIRWPADDLGSPRTPVPVFFTAGPSGSRLVRVEVAGRDAGDVSITDDRCVGVRLPAGAECRVGVRFTPQAAGTREATVTLVDERGTRLSTAIQGWSYGGTTDFHVEGPSGEWGTGGGSLTATPATRRITVDDIRPRVSAYVGGYRLALAPAPGDDLEAGRTYAPTARYPHNGSQPGLDIGASRGCNTSTGSFTVDDVSWRPDGMPRSLSVRFEQRCEDSPLVARGRLRYRVGDTTPPAPWMVASTTSAPPTPPPTSSEPTVAPEPTPTAVSLLPSAASGSGAGAPAAARTPASSTASTSGGAPVRQVSPPAVIYRGLRDGGRVLRYTLTVPSAGSATLTPWIRVGGRTVPLGRRSTVASRSGARTVSVTVPRAARGAVRRAGRGVRLSTRLTWAARGAAPATSRTVVPLRGR